MKTVNTHEAKTQLSKYLAMAERGEEVVIARNGKPVAVLSRFKAHDGGRLLGALRGQVWIAADFGEPLSDDDVDPWYAATVFSSPADT